MKRTPRKPDPLLRTQPWKMTFVFDPVERVLHRLELDGTVDVEGRRVVFREDGRGGWYDLPAALRGLIEFHELAARRHGMAVDVGPLTCFANKLEADSPIFEADLTAVRECITACKKQAMNLRVSEAEDVVKTVQIGMEIQSLKERKRA